MDFGTFAAASAGLRIYEASARRSGRTLMILRAMGERDTLMVTNDKLATSCLRILRAMGKPDCRVQVLDYSQRHPLDTMHHARRGAGHIWLDHSIYEDVYTRAILKAKADLEAMAAVQPPVHPLDTIRETHPAVGQLRRDEVWPAADFLGVKRFDV